MNNKHFFSKSPSLMTTSLDFTKIFRVSLSLTVSLSLSLTIFWLLHRFVLLTLLHNIQLLILQVSITKDVDGFHPLNIGKLSMRNRDPSFVPCTPRVRVERRILYSIALISDV